MVLKKISSSKGIGVERGTGLADDYYHHIRRARYMWKTSTSDRRSAGVDKSFLWLISRLDSIAACLFLNMTYSTDEKYYSAAPDSKIPIMTNLFSLLEHVMPR